jgi:rhodanese-related sulfurtransferase
MIKKLSLIALLTASVAVIGCKKEETKAGDAPEKAQSARTETKTDTPVAAKVEPSKAHSKDPHDMAGVGKLSPDDVEKLLAEKKAHCFDANGKETRAEHGSVPGAKLLASYKDYDLGVLPESKDSKLVFYCSNTQCGAAPKAAERAVLAGYSDVNVMPAGIMGWKEAGKKTTAIN